VTLPFDVRRRLPGRPPDDRGAWRPQLVTALRPAWRDTGSLQFGVDPARAVIVDGVDERSVRLLLALDGARSDREVLADAAVAGLHVPTLAALLTDLRAAGVLADAPGGRPPDPPAVLPTPPPFSATRPIAPTGTTPERPAAGPAGGTAGGPRPVPTSDQAGTSEAAGPAAPARPDSPAGPGPGGVRRKGRRPAPKPSGVPATVAGRLAPDRASLALLAADQGAPAEVPDDRLDRRRAAAVVVHGAGRVGTPLAALLAAAGVGHVHVVDRGPVRPADVAPGGLALADLHRSRGGAAADAIRRCAPEAQTAQLSAHRLPDLVVIASARPVDSDLTAALGGAGVPHLVAGVRETTAVVGPLVLPGRTSCLRCGDLHRSDRDPAWPLLAAQLTDQRMRAPADPCDVALAAQAAAMAALQCLGHLDGEAVDSRGGTLELALPGWRVRRRTWPPHRRCDCGAWVAAGDGSDGQGEWLS
jgi:hypothetical protein